VDAVEAMKRLAMLAKRASDDGHPWVPSAA
jgi:hypothetical protein